MRRMVKKWEEMGRSAGEGTGEEKRKEEMVGGGAFSEMLIDAGNSMRNKPTLSPIINYKNTQSFDS